MPKRKKRIDFSSLVEKYQGLSVVSEIEKNLVLSQRSEAEIEKFVLSDLFDEKNYNLEIYHSLKDSLIKDGFLMPLIVLEKEDGTYEILNGVKRYLLAKKLNYQKIPYVKTELTTERKLEYILENIMKEDDNPLVKTYAYLRLEKEYSFSDEKIAILSGVSVNQVRNLKRLNQLPSFLKEGLIDNTLTYSEARSLLNLPKEKQIALYERIKNGSLSVRDLEREKRTYLGNSKKRKVTLNKKSITIQFSDIEEAKKFYPIIKKQYSD